MSRFAPALAVVALTSVISVAFAARWDFLASVDTPFGIDGYYYAIQLRALLEDGRLYYPASPMVFWLLLPGAGWLGPIAGAKLGAALGTALAGAPVFAIVRRATGSRAAGLIAAALIATSAGSFFLATEFVKQGVGLTIALTFVATLAAAFDATDAKSRRARYVFAALLFAATLLSHLTSVGIAVLFVTPMLAVRARRVTGARSTRALKVGAVSLIALATLATLVVLLVPAARQEMGLAQLIGPASLDFITEHRTGRETAAAAFAAILLGLGVLATQRQKLGTPSAEARALLIGPALFAVVVAMPWLSQQDPNGLVYRLRVMTFVSLAICAPAVLALVVSRLAHRAQVALMTGVAFAVLTLIPLRAPQMVNFVNHSWMTELAKIAEHTPPDAVILVSRHELSFMVKWSANREARRRAPLPEDRRPLFHLASPGVLPTEVLDGLSAFVSQLPPEIPPPVALIPERPRSMLLFADSTWQRLQAFSAHEVVRTSSAADAR